MIVAPTPQSAHISSQSQHESSVDTINAICQQYFTKETDTKARINAKSLGVSTRARELCI